MVIGGEKAPAFNGTTLTLPPPQIDNTSRIIENTRRNYSRSRSEIEQEISLAIRPPESLQRPPVAHPQHIKWPIGIKPIDNTNATNTIGQSTPHPTPVVSEAGIQPRRKRTRSHKKKTGTPYETTAQIKTENKDSTLQIKH